MTLSEFLLARIAEDEAEIASFGEPAPMEGGPIPYPRLLAECEAKRRIVDIHYNGSPETDRERCSPCDTVGDDPCPTLRALALPYADHPAYREEWLPTRSDA